MLACSRLSIRSIITGKYTISPARWHTRSAILYPVHSILPRCKLLQIKFLSTQQQQRKPSIERHENIYTIPNILTLTRLASAPIIAYCIIKDQHLIATGLLAYATVTDLLDGWIARRYKLESVVGTVIDPMADKFLMLSLVGSLAYQGRLPMWLVVIILGRDVLLGISAIYYRWISLPPPKSFTRYWDFSLPSAEVHPTTISKVNTMLQFFLMAALTVDPLLTFTAFNFAPYIPTMQ